MARTTSIALRAGMWCVAVLACATSALWTFSACRTTTPVSGRPAPVRLAIGYAGPGRISGVGARALGYLITAERLVQLKRDGRIEPSLAERWEQSADGLTWRFILRPNLTFHDGKPIDAEVCARQVRACQAGGCRDIAAVETDGPRTIVVRMRRPSALLLDSLVNDVAIYGDEARVVSAGPFRSVPNAPGAEAGPDGRDTFTFEAFPQYHRGYPAVDRVDLKLFPNARNAWAAMMRGEIDMLYEVAPDALDFIEQSSNTQVRSFLRPYVFAMSLNVKHPVLADRDVRRALNMAVNRTEIIKRVFRDHAYPATDHVWPRHWAYDHELPRLRYDPAKAIELLEAKGLRIPPVGANGATPRDTPSRFRFTCMILEGDTRFERMGLLLQRQLAEVGVDMRIEAVPATELMKRLPTGQFEAVLLDMISNAGLDRVYGWWHSPEGAAKFSETGYTGADAALDRLREARTEEETRQAVRSVQQAMRDDPPAVFLLWADTARAVSARFRVPLTPNRDIFATLPRWTLVSPPDATSAASSPSSP
jgi:peptide/nickel transport system substrate-binding protein